jgi:ABC-2 type transport system ATP-binding protein
MTFEPVILFENVSVRYRVPREHVSGIKEFAIRWLQRRIQFEEFWALNEISFDIHRGEVFGIIGRNGAGKSTLLKVMARVLQPTRGRVVMCGLVAPLLELGGGFHPELIGRENIYLNMALLGHPRRATDSLFDSIVDFAEISEFIDAPLRTYSTGMVARLGFAVATCLRPDILLVDEVLSVGDRQFQQKCLDRMRSFQEQGTTVAIVSHSMGTIESFCDRAMLLQHGRIGAIGDINEVIDRYIQKSEPGASYKPLPEAGLTTMEEAQVDYDEPYVSLPSSLDIFSTQKIFDVNQGTVSAWIKIDPQSIPKDAIIFHTDDSRYVLYLTVYHDEGQNRYLRKLVARAGGNRRASDTLHGGYSFPEVSLVIDDPKKPPKAARPKQGWHLATMTWIGYPSGTLSLYLDGASVGKSAYDAQYDDGRDLPAMFAIGLRPSIWSGELVEKEDGTLADSRPGASMSISEAGVEIQGMRLYQKALSQASIERIYDSG